MPVFPLFDASVDRRLHDEQQLLAHVNTVATELGLPALRGLPEVYRADLTLVHTLSLLDPYARWRREPCLPPVQPVALAQELGDELFVYFSTSEFQHPDVVEVLANLPVPRRGYCPALPADMADRLRASGMVLEPAASTAFCAWGCWPGCPRCACLSTESSGITRCVRRKPGSRGSSPADCTCAPSCTMR
jgi:hypothetical protein